MKNWILLGAFLSPLAVTGCSHPTPVVYAPPPPAAVDTVAQRGYNDGFEAARRDVAQQRPPVFKQHPRYRNPPVPADAISDYRQAFRRGYEAFLHQGPPPRGASEQLPPPPPPPSMQ